MFRLRYVALLYSTFAFGLLTDNAIAQVCNSSNVDHTNTNGEKLYRVNSPSFGAISGVDNVSGLAATLAAADTWNEQANAGYFRYHSSTTLTDIPPLASTCSATGVNYSLVRVVDAPGPAKADTAGRCCASVGPQSACEQFLITVYTKDASGVSWDWSVGVPSSSHWDLVQTLTHEFGHTMGLGHPLNGEQAVMTPTSKGSTKQRDLYQWDLECGESISGRRAVEGYRYQHSSGAFGPAALWSASGASKGTPAMFNFQPLGGWTASGAVFTDTCARWNGWTSPCISGVSQDVGIGPLAATYMEDDLVHWVFHSSATDHPVAYSSTGKHQLRRNRSTKLFSNQSQHNLGSCKTMSSWMACADSGTQLYSGKRAAIAYDDLIDRSHFVWVNQNRLTNDNSRKLFISTGTLSNSLLPPPVTIDNVRVSTTPGMACKAYQAGGYDCVLAYVDESDPYYQVQVRRLWFAAGATHYIIGGLDPNSYTVGTTPLATSSAIAVWYQNGEWWLAARPRVTNQGIRVWKSTDGATWTNALPPTNPSLGLSIVGPSVVSYWTGDNVLLAWR